MKKNIQLLITGVAIVILAANLASCTSYRSIASRPDGHNHYRPDLASLRIAKHHHDNGVKVKAADATACDDQTSATTKPAKKQPKFIAELTGDAPMQMRLPKYAVDGMDDDKMEKVNDALAKYSNHKVSLAKTSNGRIVLKADSRKEFMKLTKVLFNERKAAAPISEEAQDILALVGGICGIVAIALCLVPWANYLSFPTGIAGIVLGALSLHSERRHKWALLGIILGSIGLFLAIVMTVVYTFFLYGVLI
jgi:hypothetical protein